MGISPRRRIPQIPHIALNPHPPIANLRQMISKLIAAPYAIQTLVDAIAEFDEVDLELAGNNAG
jgi:hypothetical protein